MDYIELNDYFAQVGLPEAGRHLVMKARREAPVRDVVSRLGNVISHYQSRKMRKTVIAESLHVEFPAFIQYEHDPNVLEYHPQPLMFDLRLVDPISKKVSRLQHTPDVLVLRRNSVCIDEWKDEKQMEQRATKYPHRYRKDGGRWRDPQIEDHLNPFGIDYCIRTSSEHPVILVQNLRFLSDYYAPEATSVSQEALAQIHKCLEEHAEISIADLIELGRTSAQAASDG